MIDSFSGNFRYLSNFYPCIIYDALTDKTYPSAEHAYQAAKTLDASWARQIREAPTAAEAKRLGKLAPLRWDWDHLKVDVMRDILRMKFRCWPTENGKQMLFSKLARDLMDTHPFELVEGNTWNDTFWGVCRGVGENWLGRLLMERRTKLRDYDV